MSWLYIHIPRTGGSTIREQIGMGAADSKVEHLPLRAYNVNGAVPFTVVRNPFDRAVSLAAILQPNRHHDQITPEFFEAWVRGGFQHQTMNPATRWPLSVADPQSHFFGADDGFAGRFEFFQKTLDAVSEITGVVLRPASYRAGGHTHHMPWMEYYRRPEIRDAVIEKYEQDFVQFAYSPTIKQEQ